jgi:hypothetical protein
MAARIALTPGSIGSRKISPDVMGAIENWMELTFTRYVGSLQRRPAEVLAEMRRSLRAKGDSYRASFRSRAGRLWAAQQLDEMFGKLIVDELNSGAVPEATLFDAVDSLKARTLLDQLSGRFKTVPDAAAREKLAGLERDVMRFAPGAGRDPSDQLTTEEILVVSRLPIGSPWDHGERRDALERLEQAYAEHGGGFEGVEAVIDLASLQQALGSRELLIEYFIPYRPLHPAIELLTLAVTRDTCVARRIDFSKIASGFIGRLEVDGKQPIDASPLGSLVFDIRTHIQRGSDDKAKRALAQLDELLMWPLREEVMQVKKIDHVIVVPHGMLHSIPFAALGAETGRRLIEDAALTVAPSATVWQRLATARRPKPSTFLGLANPLADTRPLPAAQTEVSQIAEGLKPMPCTVLTGNQATKAALRDNLHDKSILHFATHGEFPESDAIDFHRIMLAGTAGDDGRLNAEDLRQMDLHAVRLAVLSICNGGLYRFGPGDEPYGLMPVFLGAGAENVVGTLWPLEDDFGRIFMRRLYREKLALQPTEALQKTASYFIGKGAQLRQWASITLVGAGRPLG